MGRSYAPRFEVVKHWGEVPESARHLIQHRWHFRVVAGNGRVLCHSEGYWRKSDCLKAIRAVKRARTIKVAT